MQPRRPRDHSARERPPRPVVDRRGDRTGAGGGRVLGVDGCREGWVGVAPDLDGPRAYAAPDLRTLLERAEQDGALVRVGIDIPVGLVDAGWRRPDLEARARLGPRRSSLFVTPVRAALEAPDHARGIEISRAASGGGFSIQAWGLRSKILEVDAVVRAGEDRVLEVHPADVRDHSRAPGDVRQEDLGRAT